ncbi:acyltransferase 3 domain protein [Mycobacterium xenopi 3993]|nr:acyltransferase 3 domain protein [Mycobacterium xenopi 3993]
MGSVGVVSVIAVFGCLGGITRLYPCRVTDARASPPAGGGRDLPAEFTGQGAHVGGRQVVGVVVDQHVSLDRAADVGAADRVA